MLRISGISPSRQACSQHRGQTDHKLLVALVLDAIYQLIVFQWIYPIQALIVATLLALIPCMIVRATGNRIVSLARRRQLAEHKEVPEAESKTSSNTPEVSHHHDNPVELR